MRHCWSDSWLEQTEILGETLQQHEFLQHQPHMDCLRNELGISKLSVVHFKFLFQLLVSLVASFSTVASGMSLGFSAIALPEMLKKDSQDNLDIDQASWFGTSRPSCKHGVRFPPLIHSFIYTCCLFQPAWRP